MCFMVIERNYYLIVKINKVNYTVILKGYEDKHGNQN